MYGIWALRHTNFSYFYILNTPHPAVGEKPFFWGTFFLTDHNKSFYRDNLFYMCQTVTNFFIFLFHLFLCIFSRLSARIGFFFTPSVTFWIETRNLCALLIISVTLCFNQHKSYIRAVIHDSFYRMYSNDFTSHTQSYHRSY